MTTKTATKKKEPVAILNAWVEWNQGYIGGRSRIHIGLELGDRVLGGELTQKQAIAQLIGESEDLDPKTIRLTKITKDRGEMKFTKGIIRSHD